MTLTGETTRSWAVSCTYPSNPKVLGHIYAQYLAPVLTVVQDRWISSIPRAIFSVRVIGLESVSRAGVGDQSRIQRLSISGWEYRSHGAQTTLSWGLRPALFLHPSLHPSLIFSPKPLRKISSGFMKGEWKRLVANERPKSTRTQGHGSENSRVMDNGSGWELGV